MSQCGKTIYAAAVSGPLRKIYCTSMARITKVIFIGDAAMAPYEVTQAGGSVEHWNEEPGLCLDAAFYAEKFKKLHAG